MLANWLLGAVVKIVTTYTKPGQRVLLLAPAAYLSCPAGRVSPLRRNQAQADPYVGLHEASWTVVRLGRGVQVATAVADSELLTEAVADKPAGPQDGPGRDTTSASDEHVVGQPTERLHEPDSITTAHGPDLYDLIIAAAGPHTLSWFRPTDWANVLTPTGTLAVITHGDSSDSRFIDPARQLVPAARHVGLQYLDRIALLREPVSPGPLSPARCVGRDRSPILPRRSTVPVRHRNAYTDLLLFTHQRALAQVVDRVEASDE
ncbi:hypothetical protein [Lentzea sp. NPDC004782]|uniref:hypothetical protein n=1 Tax=Lentzea sp. NPDC004782 TaxID=3154458 RepID=UPI0033B8942A